jgi:hypothetical protein
MEVDHEGSEGLTWVDNTSEVELLLKDSVSRDSSFSRRNESNHSEASAAVVQGDQENAAKEVDLVHKIEPERASKARILKQHVD